MTKKLSALAFLLVTGIAYNQTCNRIILDDDFSTPSNWTVVSSTGSITLMNGAAYLEDAHGMNYNTVYQSLNTTVSNTYFKLDSEFEIMNFNADDTGPNGLVVALTAGTLDPLSYDQSNNFAETNQDAVMVILSSANSTGMDPEDWFFIFEAKDGVSRTYDINHKIYVNPNILKYYLSLERLSATTLKFSVYTDAARTIHLSGSPYMETIASTTDNLSAIHHGSLTFGNDARTMDAIFDNDLLCDDIIENLGVNEIQSDEVTIYPNPTATSFKVQTSNKFETFEIYSGTGGLYSSGDFTSGQEISISELNNGVYFLKLINNDGTQITERITVKH